MKSKITKTKFLYDRVIRQNYYLIVNKSYNKFREIAKNELSINIKDKDDYGSGLCHLSSAGHILIWIKDKEDLESILHECFHAVYLALTNRGINCFPHKSDDTYQEIYAYNVAFVSSYFLRKLNYRRK